MVEGTEFGALPCSKCEAERQAAEDAASERARALAEQHGRADVQKVDEARTMPIGAIVTWLFRSWPRWIVGLGMLFWIIVVIAIANGKDSPFHASGFIDRIGTALVGGVVFPVGGGILYLGWKLVWGLLAGRPQNYAELHAQQQQNAKEAAERIQNEYERKRALAAIAESGVLRSGDKLAGLVVVYAFFCVSAFVMSFFGSAGVGGGGSPPAAGVAATGSPASAGQTSQLGAGGGRNASDPTAPRGALRKCPDEFAKTCFDLAYASCWEFPDYGVAAKAGCDGGAKIGDKVGLNFRSCCERLSLDKGLLPPPPSGTVEPPRSGIAAPSRRVKIAGGTFAMGATDGDADEKPVHDVTVAPFELDETEVTVAAYGECAKSGQCTTVGLESVPTCNWGKADRSDHPINCVDWSQATAFCTWAGARLPTEEEWEFAAKGGSEQRLYPWGAAQLSSQACWSRTSGGHTCAVRSFPTGVSKDGIYDLGGNVWEWTASPYCDYPDTTCSEARRVLRGGGFGNQLARYERGTSRAGKSPTERLDAFGFRCAL